MADNDLRRVSRAKLIDIIYALQQNEQALREDNEELKNQSNDLQQKEQALREEKEKLTNQLSDLQQNEQVLREDNEELKNQLNEQIRRSRSVAKAARNVNRIFEDAQDAADQYLRSIRDLTGNKIPTAVDILADARNRADAILAEAEARVKEISPDRQDDSGGEETAPEQQDPPEEAGGK